MVKCKCGCNEDVNEGKTFIKGHYSKWKAARKIPIMIKGPDPGFKPDETKTEPEKFKAFLDQAPIWSTNLKEGFIRSFLRGLFNKEYKLIKCVFVGENRPPRIIQLPYDAEKNRLIIPGKAFYQTPINGDIAFFHEDYFMPLVNSPDLSKRFMLPSHVVEYAYSAGLAEGKAQAFNDLLKDMGRWRFIMIISLIVAVLAIAGAVLIAYQSNISVKYMAAQMANMTAQMAADNNGFIINPNGG